MGTSDEELRRAVWQAVDAGDFVQTKALLSEGSMAIGTTDSDGVTLLHLAAVQGNTGLLSLMLDAGININVADNTGQTPLHYAAWNGSAEAATQLLERGADVCAEDEVGDTPADFADEAGHQSTADLLHAAEREASDLSEYEDLPVGTAGPFGSSATIRRGGALDEERLIQVLREQAGFIEQSAERAHARLFLAYLIDHNGVGMELNEDLDEDAQREVYSDFRTEYSERIAALAFYHKGYTDALREVTGCVCGEAGPIGLPGDKFVGVYEDVPDLSELTRREKAMVKRLLRWSSADIHEVVKAFRKREWR